ncbi:hypothetical protein HELRODRAFT_161906 [Helobdella robusta]|uniref:Uncharacterized protein n=1 Tax=Helobdella robusta TaxID=6412 RepID=T1ES10_HELRO|nr:hypothetical protein HELRODRAFT_161906 [Helobdella robusta]ESO02618.1 hypothetical protein HELRODRAFT_161906 [Helobdella robusta]
MNTKPSSNTTESRILPTKVDPVKWLAWSDWTPCSTSCGDGAMLRTRSCAINIGCEGIDHEYVSCYNPPCTESKPYHDAKFMAIGVVVLINISMLCCITIPYFKRRKVNQPSLYQPPPNQQTQQQLPSITLPQELYRQHEPGSHYSQYRNESNPHDTDSSMSKLDYDYVASPYVKTSDDKTTQQSVKNLKTDSLRDNTDIIDSKNTDKSLDQNLSPRIVHSNPDKLGTDIKQQKVTQANSSPAILHKTIMQTDKKSLVQHSSKPDINEHLELLSLNLISTSQNEQTTEDCNRQHPFEMGDSIQIINPAILPVDKTSANQKQTLSGLDGQAFYRYRPSNIEAINPYRYRPSINDNQHCNATEYRMTKLSEDSALQMYRPSLREFEKINYRTDQLGSLQYPSEIYRPDLNQKVCDYVYRPPEHVGISSQDRISSRYRPSINDIYNKIKPDGKHDTSPLLKLNSSVLDSSVLISGGMVESHGSSGDVLSNDVLKFNISHLFLSKLESLKERMVVSKDQSDETKFEQPSKSDEPDEPSNFNDTDARINIIENREESAKHRRSSLPHFRQKFFKVFSKHFTRDVRRTQNTSSTDTSSVETIQSVIADNYVDKVRKPSNPTFTLTPTEPIVQRMASESNDRVTELNQASIVLPIRRAGNRSPDNRITDSKPIESPSYANKLRPKNVSFAKSSQIKYIPKEPSVSGSSCSNTCLFYNPNQMVGTPDNDDDNDSNSNFFPYPRKPVDVPSDGRFDDDPTGDQVDKMDHEDKNDDDDKRDDNNADDSDGGSVNTSSSNKNKTSDLCLTASEEQNENKKKNLYNQFIQKFRYKPTTPANVKNLNVTTSSENGANRNNFNKFKTIEADVPKPKRDSKRINFVGIFKRHIHFKKVELSKPSCSDDTETVSLVGVHQNLKKSETINQSRPFYNTFETNIQTGCTETLPLENRNVAGIIQTPNNKNNNRINTCTPSTNNPSTPISSYLQPSRYSEKNKALQYDMTSPITSEITTPPSVQSTFLLMAPDSSDDHQLNSDDNKTRDSNFRTVGIDNSKIGTGIDEEPRRNRPIGRNNVGKIRMSEEEIEVIRSRRKFLEGSSSSTPSSSSSSSSSSSLFYVESSLTSRKQL